MDCIFVFWPFFSIIFLGIYVNQMGFQGSWSWGFDFPSQLTFLASIEAQVLIDGVKIPYLSWSFLRLSSTRCHWFPWPVPVRFPLSYINWCPTLLCLPYVRPYFVALILQCVSWVLGGLLDLQLASTVIHLLNRGGCFCHKFWVWHQLLFTIICSHTSPSNKINSQPRSVLLIDLVFFFIKPMFSMIYSPASKTNLRQFFIGEWGPNLGTHNIKKSSSRKRFLDFYLNADP